MTGREIVSLVWHRSGLQIEVGYAEGDPEHWIGSDVVAAVLASDAGLHLMPSSDDAVRWVRDPYPCTVASRLRGGPATAMSSP
jgi:hypothetical protein